MIECAFLGTLGRDGEVKSSKSGKQYLRLNLRVGGGDSAQWVGAMIFGDDVDELAAKMVKGSRVYIEGKLSLDEWTGKDGSKRSGLSVMSFHCRLVAIGKNRPEKQ